MMKTIDIARSSGLTRPLAAVAVVAAFITGCDELKKNTVCKGPAKDTTVLSSVTKSDLELSQEMTPKVAAQALERAVESCGTLSVGLLGGKHAEADLVVEAHRFEPEKEEVYGSTEPILEEMRVEGEKFLDEKLLGPLSEAEGANGSPFLGGLARLAAELSAHGRERVEVVIVGDGLAIEKGRDGEPLDFTAVDVDEQAVTAFADLYEPLAGSCVMLAGSGGRSNISDERLRRARRLLEDVLAEKEVGFVATRGGDIPWSCR